MTRTLSEYYGFHILKDLLWQDSVISFYDPNSGLPVSPTFRDRYVSSSSANGWIENYIYEWDTESWFEMIPTWGSVTLNLDDNKYYFYNGSGWLFFDTIIDHNELTNTHQEVYTTSSPSFNKVSITGALDTDTDAVTKNYVDNIVQGLNWQDGVISFYDPSTGLPSSPSDDDRYIASATANGWTKDNIYRWHLSEWVEIVTENGFVAWVENEDRKYVYNNGWVYFGETVTHDNLIGVNPATATYLGHVKVGDGLIVDVDGTIHYDPPEPVVWDAGNKSYIGDHSGSTITVTHGMNVEYVYVQCITQVDKKVIIPDVIQTIDTNNVYLEFSESVNVTVLIREITGSAGWVEWDISQDHQGVDIHEDNITSLSVTQHEADINHDALTNYDPAKHFIKESITTLYSNSVSPSGLVYVDSGGTLHIDTDIVQDGSIYETHTEQLYTNNDLIITREDAIAAISVGDISGMKITNYDGLNHLLFGTDYEGYFKVGEDGNLQILATREDSPIDTAVPFWNDTAKRFDTSSDLTWNNSASTLSISGNIVATQSWVLENNSSISLDNIDDVNAPNPIDTYVLTWNDTLGYWEPRDIDTVAAEAPVDNVFGRIGTVTALAGDYSASQITNDSVLTGDYVDDALNNLSSTSDVSFGSTTYGNYRIEHNSVEDSLDFVYLL